MLTDDHTLVDLGLCADEHFATVFKVPESIGHGLAIFHGNQNASAAAWHWAFVGRPAVEHAVQNACAAGVCEEFTVITDEAT